MTSLYLITQSHACPGQQVSEGLTCEVALVCYCSNMFTLSVYVAVWKAVPHTPLSLVYRSAQISAVLLWVCSGWNAKLSSQHCSTFHSQSQQTCALWSILGQGYKSCLFSAFFKKKRGKNVSYFFPSLQQRVTFFDVSTESLVLQYLLPDALIESPMSNRKRNKCFIERELSLVLVGGRNGERKKGRGEQAPMWVSVGVSTLGKGYSQPSVQALS